MFVIIPDKHRLFPEYLPNWFQHSGEARRKEQLLAALEQTNISVLDLTSALLEAKLVSKESIWQKSDTHWNGIGSYYAYQAILRNLGPYFPTLQPLAREALILTNEFSEAPGVWHGSSNLATQLGVPELFPESWQGLVPSLPTAVVATNYPAPTQSIGSVNEPYATEMNESEYPSALLIGGSFRWGLVPMLSESFSRILYTDFRHCYFDPELAAAEKPDCILFVITERQLLWFPNPPQGNIW